MDIYTVKVTRKAEKKLLRLPLNVLDNFYIWIEAVIHNGIREVRKTKSYHDEPLQGKRFGQRSIRLNRSYRAFYVEKSDGILEFIEVQEINKHVY